MRIFSTKTPAVVDIFRIALFLIFVSLPLANADARPKTLVVLGDSLSAGYQLPRGTGFPEQLAMQLVRKGYDIDVVNAGVSGDTTAAGLARLDWAVPDGTDAVIVELGGNDALRGIDPRQTYNNLDQILTRLKAKGCKVLLAGIEAPRNLGNRYVTALHDVFTNLAEKHHVPLYPFFLEGVALHPELLLADGIHPNKKGVLKIVDNILPYVERWLDRQNTEATNKS